MTPPQGYALITGASYGLGEEFARQLAAREWSVILVARSQDRLERLSDELQAGHPGIDVRTITLDLTRNEAPRQLFEKTQADGLVVTLLVNNAGFGAFGEFSTIERGRLRQMIDLNIAALVELSHLYLQRMSTGTSTEKCKGTIINIASVAGFLPLPYSAVYAATKAFVLSFSLALHEEARRHGVHVMVVNPGTTKTNFFEVAGTSPYNNPASMQTAAEVVTESLRAFDRGLRLVTTGAANRWMLRAIRLIPRNIISAAVGYQMRRVERPS